MAQSIRSRLFAPDASSFSMSALMCNSMCFGCFTRACFGACSSVASGGSHTQARLAKADSSDTNSNWMVSVRGLSKGPLKGTLFRHNDDSSSHLKRAFLPPRRATDFSRASGLSAGSGARC
jgi:hypothetical protein